jgi:lauroyl/myristoyl acyltransferase
MSLREHFRISDLAWLAGRLPRKLYFSLLSVSAALRLVSLQSRWRWVRSPHRRVIQRNLAQVFPSKTAGEIRTIARRHLDYLKKRRLQTQLPLLRGFHIPHRWPVENRQALDAALSRGKGAILVFVHFGYARLIKHILRMHGYSLMVVGAGGTSRIQKEENRDRAREGWSAFRRYLSARVDVVVNLTEQRDLVAGLNVRPYFQALQENKVLLMGGDSDHSVNFESFPVLGASLAFPTGFMRVAMATGASVLPVFGVDGGGRYDVTVVLDGPLQMEGNANTPEHVRANLERLAQLYDSYARRWPALVRDWTKGEWGEDGAAKDLGRRLADLRPTTRD